MKIRDWLEELEYELLSGSLDEEVSEVCYDSRKAAPGAVFVCMAGTRVDSHRFAAQAVKAGARVIAAERGIDSVAFCCISTGEFHFPNRGAAEIAVDEVLGFLGENPGIKKVIFNVFKDIDRVIYGSLLG